MKITRIETLHVRLAAPNKGRVSLTHPVVSESTELIAVVVHDEANNSGLGFTTTTTAGKALRQLIDNDLAPSLIGEEATAIERLYARTQTRFRSVGWAGLVARAYAAIDIALWDLKAKQAGLPLSQLLGGMRDAVPCFVGDLAPLGTDSAQTLKAARPFLEQGVLGVSVEVGSGDVNSDADRVQQIRDGLGESAWLGISGDGRYDLATAMAMAHFYEDDVGIDWIDAPIPTTDHVGYRRLAERMEVPLALGATFTEREDFRTILEQGNVRVLRPDVLRLGGITPFLKIAALADAFHVTLVPYRLPEIGVHLACALPNVPMAEYGSWLTSAFAQPCQPTNGKLAPLNAPGHGWVLREGMKDEG
jgi:L-alanine-DL-glutamate epimerase-like enolase superfamily enzyme